MRVYYILTTCEPHRVFNRRDSAWARVCFVARLGLECSGSFGKEIHISAALFGVRERRGLNFDAQVRSGLMLLWVSIFSTQRNKIQYHLFCAKEVGPLLWEVRKLAMLSTTPGIDSVYFIASRLQHKCSWCSEMIVVQHNAVD